MIEQTLYLDSDVCRESALHGLGRWHYDYAKEVEAIIDGFLSRKPELRPELKFFALEARRGKDETFETWIKYFFDHPVPTNLSAIDVNYWGQWFPPTISVAYITRAFENASELLAPYSDAQLNQGLWHLAHEDIPDLWSDELPWADQKQGVEAIFTLFEQFFAVRCSSALSHTMRSKEDAAQANPLNSICYMWWDIFPTWGHPNDPDDKQFDAALLDVMERSLYIDSDACREGALHGLGHWYGRYGEKVTRIIEKFIAGVPELPPDLKEYALNAKYGSVL